MNDKISEESCASKEKESSHTDLNCTFLPIRVLENIIERISQQGKQKYIPKCPRNLIQLQSDALNYRKSTRLHMTWLIRFNYTVNKAVRTQNWNKVLRLLKTSPIWEHYSPNAYSTTLPYVDTYLKAFVLLLMYHPSSKAQSLMSEFLHMVLSLRTDEEKRAFMKVLISISDKPVIRYSCTKHWSLQRNGDFL